MFTFSAIRIPTQPTPQMQHIRNQDTYTYHKWFTPLNTSCVAEAINNNAPMGGGPRPVYASPVRRLTFFYAIPWVIHIDPTGLFKKLTLDAVNGI